MICARRLKALSVEGGRAHRARPEQLHAPQRGWAQLKWPVIIERPVLRPQIYLDMRHNRPFVASGSIRWVLSLI